MIQKKNVGNGYWAYPCQRCIGGTMAFEKDKLDTPPYLKCVLCGYEFRESKTPGKTEKNAGTSTKSETVADKKSRNKRDKRRIKSYKWQFTHAQGGNK